MINTLLLSDTYKQVHSKMYPEGLTKLVSYWVPRRSMLKSVDKMVFFGLQAFIKKYLIEEFDNNFFKRPLNEVVSEYSAIMDIQIGHKNAMLDRIIKLHNLGYLPLSISALPEGTRVPMGVPCIEITNTHESFAWVVQWIECLLQVELWKSCCHATIGYLYNRLVSKYYLKTVDDLDDYMIRSACSDFGMRGMSCIEEAMKCSAAWLLSFNKTSTIPAISYIDKYYKEVPDGVGKGGVSTEHSVMSVNYAIDGDEITFFKKLITEIYPTGGVSIVSDTYDYWNVINNIVPKLKDDILNRDGVVLIRPDSGDIVDVSVRSIKSLMDTFGYTVNSKGYKVLDPHIRLIYGDACTLSNVEQIFIELEKLGIASNNIVFGVGAFCFSAIIEDNKLIAMTRDTFGIAMKATYAEVDGRSIYVHKDPATDTSKLKKSHKGYCRVYEDKDGLAVQDELLIKPTNNALKEVFKDGDLLIDRSFIDIITNLYFKY